MVLKIRQRKGPSNWPPVGAKLLFGAKLVHALEDAYPAPMREDVRLTIITIYRSPRDYPGLYVAREWQILQAGGLVKGDVIAQGPLLQDAQAPAMRQGLHLIPRDPTDDQSIVESWI